MQEHIPLDRQKDDGIDDNMQILHPRDNTDRLYVSRNVRGRRLASIKVLSKISKERISAVASNIIDSIRTNWK